MTDYRSLGLAPLPAETIAHDFAILAKFQDYSAELLRLSLLGITAIGVAVSQVLLAKSSEMDNALTTLHTVRWYLYVALALFCVSAAAALYHRYTSADSLAWHLQAMRRYVRGSDKDLPQANLETQARYRQFKSSQRGLQIAAGCLALGAVAFAAALGRAIS
jgi:hypothetical protein